MRHVRAVVVLFAILGVILGGCSSPAGNRVAVVNGQSITKDALEVRLQIYELFFRQPMSNSASKQQLLNQMVTERLLASQASKLQVSVTDAQVETEMARFFGALDRQYKNREEVNAQLQNRGLTNDAISAFIHDFLLSQAVVDKKKQLVNLEEAELKQFYDQNKGSLYTFQDDVVRAAHILVPLDQAEKAQEISAKARAGGDFAELAKIYSVDPGSSRTGGDLGYFTLGTMVKEFSEAAFAMDAGQISEPVQSQFGWHVIKLLDERGPGTLSFQEARGDVLNRLLPQRQDQVFEQWLNDLEKSAKIEKMAVTQSPVN